MSPQLEAAYIFGMAIGALYLHSDGVAIEVIVVASLVAISSGHMIERYMRRKKRN